ncbi:hypothetical protein HA402_008800 [Bradysia odoriphaga]|nr:hypothetical protein HA402_008800 [Bradysia odoriphaga]
MNFMLYGFCGFMLLSVTLFGDSVAKIHPDEKCWLEETSNIFKSYKRGETLTTKTGCIELTCTHYENHWDFVYRRCPFILNQSNCTYVVKNPDAKFPACCPEVIC